MKNENLKMKNEKKNEKKQIWKKEYCRQSQKELAFFE